jgi:hypothetical protein
LSRVSRNHVDRSFSLASGLFVGFGICQLLDFLAVLRGLLVRDLLLREMPAARALDDARDPLHHSLPASARSWKRVVVSISLYSREVISLVAMMSVPMEEDRGIEETEVRGINHDDWMAVREEVPSPASHTLSQTVLAGAFARAILSPPAGPAALRGQ